MIKFLSFLSNKTIFVFVFLIFFSKIFIFLLMKSKLIDVGMGGGNDSDYYHAYVLGYESVAVNIWPVILRLFNDLGLYSREGVSYFLLFLNLFIIPIITTKLSGLKIIKNIISIVFYCV